LGTETTSKYCGTFSFAWTPPEEGTYTIIASFMGDESYGSSSAATAITVGPPPEEIEIPEMLEIPTPTDYMPMLTAVAIAVIIAIVIGMINLYALFKRKQLTPAKTATPLPLFL
jgi:hypothetical protein